MRWTGIEHHLAEGWRAAQADQRIAFLMLLPRHELDACLAFLPPAEDGPPIHKASDRSVVLVLPAVLSTTIDTRN